MSFTTWSHDPFTDVLYREAEIEAEIIGCNFLLFRMVSLDRPVPAFPMCIYGEDSIPWRSMSLARMHIRITCSSSPVIEYATVSLHEESHLWPRDRQEGQSLQKWALIERCPCISLSQ